MTVMSSVVKRSVSLPAEMFEALEVQAAEEGRTVSAALADAADLWLSTRRGLRAVRARGSEITARSLLMSLRLRTQNSIGLVWLGGEHPPRVAHGAATRL